MKNPWVKYLLLRLGTFFVILAGMLALRLDAYFSTVIAAVMALSLSLLFFGKQRDAVSKSIYDSRNKKNDNDSDHEDQALNDSKKKLTDRNRS